MSNWVPLPLEVDVGVLREVVEGLRDLPARLNAELAAIADDPRRTPEGKALDAQEARERAKQANAQLLERGRSAFESATGEARRIRSSRRVDTALLGQAERLLDRVAPADVLARAVELGDVELIAAARRALAYHTAEGRFVDAGRLVAAADEALAAVSGDGAERRENAAAVELRQAGEALETLAPFAARAAAGVPVDRIAQGYALQAVKGEGAGDGGDGAAATGAEAPAAA
ncbi:MAG: hypothetical protein ABR521_02725 [Gaiellaceae bacterium]